MKTLILLVLLGMTGNNPEYDRIQDMYSWSCRIEQSGRIVCDPILDFEPGN